MTLSEEEIDLLLISLASYKYSITLDEHHTYEGLVKKLKDAKKTPPARGA